MSTILVAAIIIAIAGIPAAFFIRFHKRGMKKRLENQIIRFRNAGANNNLLFTHQQVLRSSVLGLDAHQQKLLVFPFNKEQTERLVELADVEICTVFREYQYVMPADNKTSKGENVLRQMGLNLMLAGAGQPLLIVFYDNWENDIDELPGLENVAREWKSLVVNTVSVETQNRA